VEYVKQHQLEAKCPYLSILKIFVTSSVSNRDWCNAINSNALFAVYRVECAIYDDLATRNCPAEKIQTMRDPVTVLNFNAID